MVLGPADRKLSYWRRHPASRKLDGRTGDHANHHRARGRLPRTCTASPIALIDRDGRVIRCNLPIGNGPLLEQAPAMVQILRELVAGGTSEHLRSRAARLLERIDTERSREPGEDDQ